EQSAGCAYGGRRTTDGHRSRWCAWYVPAPVRAPNMVDANHMRSECNASETASKETVLVNFDDFRRYAAFIDRFRVKLADFESAP
ncbi:hypothetical protein ACFC1D_38695, partial [Streptomyces vinaceus]|uniref:hypothetical protein n=2 Tax=Streptomyces TaxID=1883 RepID=UPI0035E354CD